MMCRLTGTIRREYNSNESISRAKLRKKLYIRYGIHDWINMKETGYYLEQLFSLKVEV